MRSARLRGSGVSAVSRRSVVAVACALLAAACGGQEPAPESATPAPLKIRTSGAGRTVDVQMTVKRLKDPAANEFLRPAAGARFVQVDVEWRNLAAGALPIDWARFAVLDERGEAHREAFRQPERVLYHGRPDTPRIMTVGFELPNGRRPRTVTLVSAVAALRLRGSWPLAGAR